jgi:hypothetical protein
MPRLNPGRGGHTLPELLFGLALFGMLGLIALVMTISAERLLRVAVIRGQSGRTMHGAVSLFRREFESLDANAAALDLQAVASDSVTYRAIRLVGLACAVTVSEVRVLDAELAGWRGAQPGRDSLLLPGRGVVTGDSTAWLAAPLLGVGRASCPVGPATAFRTTLDTARVGLPGPGELVPVQLFEIMQLRAYPSGGQQWLGARSVSAGEVIQPAFGPLGSGGLTVVIRDSAGRPAGPVNAASVGVVIHAPIPSWSSVGGGTAPSESLAATIHLPWVAP